MHSLQLTLVRNSRGVDAPGVYEERVVTGFGGRAGGGGAIEAGADDMVNKKAVAFARRDAKCQRWHG